MLVHKLFLILHCCLSVNSRHIKEAFMLCSSKMNLDNSCTIRNSANVHPWCDYMFDGILCHQVLYIPKVWAVFYCPLCRQSRAFLGDNRGKRLTLFFLCNLDMYAKTGQYERNTHRAVNRTRTEKPRTQRFLVCENAMLWKNKRIQHLQEKKHRLLHAL